MKSMRQQITNAMMEKFFVPVVLREPYLEFHHVFYVWHFTNSTFPYRQNDVLVRTGVNDNIYQIVSSSKYL